MQIQPIKEKLFNILSSCELCPRMCRVNRLKGEKGFCGAGNTVKIGASIPHYFEEPPISGTKGAGNIFFSHCNMKCVYCQNFEISHLHEGMELSSGDLAKKMMELQEMEVHNIGFVSGTHYLPWIIESIQIAHDMGFYLPLLYNTNGYERFEILKLLEGIFDIYLPDIRYGSDNLAEKYSNTKDYVHVNKQAVIEMFRQAGHPVFNKDGIIQSGTIIRYLVLPGHADESKEIFQFIRDNISPEAYVSIMSQYFPAFNAADNPPLNRKITEDEYESVIENFFDAGLKNGWMQEPDSADECYVPDFDCIE